MSQGLTIAEDFKEAIILAPAADAAGRTGTWVKVTNAHKMVFYALINQGNAATVALTPQQATSNAGAGAKAITGARIWVCTDTATIDTLVRQTDAASYTTDAGLKIKLVIFEIDPAYLDIAGGFIWVTLVTGASNAANITAAVAQALRSASRASTRPRC